MEQLPLSQKTVVALGHLGLLEDATLKSILKFFFQSVVTGSSNTVIDDEHEPALCCISTVLLEAAKAKITSEQLNAVLVECNVMPSALTILIDLYTEHNETLIAHMERTGISAPSIVDMDWRLDYSIRSKYAEGDCVPMFFVTLRVKDRGILRDIEMIASEDEMQDLFAIVRDAVKQVDRVVSMND